MTTSFNTMLLLAASIIKADADKINARRRYITEAQREYSANPIGAQLALQRFVAKLYGVKLVPTPRSSTGYTLPKDKGAAMKYSRVLAQIAPKGKTTQRQKRNAGIERAIEALAKLDYNTLIEIQRQLPAIIKAKRAK